MTGLATDKNWRNDVGRKWTDSTPWHETIKEWLESEESLGCMHSWLPNYTEVKVALILRPHQAPKCTTLWHNHHVTLTNTHVPKWGAFHEKLAIFRIFMEPQIALALTWRHQSRRNAERADRWRRRGPEMTKHRRKLASRTSEHFAMLPVWLQGLQYAVTPSV